MIKSLVYRSMAPALSRAAVPRSHVLHEDRCQIDIVYFPAWGSLLRARRGNLNLSTVEEVGWRTRSCVND